MTYQEAADIIKEIEVIECPKTEEAYRLAIEALENFPKVKNKEKKHRYVITWLLNSDNENKSLAECGVYKRVYNVQDALESFDIKSLAVSDYVISARLVIRCLEKDAMDIYNALIIAFAQYAYNWRIKGK